MTTATLSSAPSLSIRPDNAELTSAQKLLVGGVGGMTPIIVTLMAGEFDKLPTLATPGALEFYLGFGLRALLFFAVGALFVWLHKEVNERWPVFRLGVTAPALIAAMLGSAPAEARAADGHFASWPAEAAAAPIAAPLPDDLVFGKCTLLDGFLGRKCDKP